MLVVTKCDKCLVHCKELEENLGLLHDVEYLQLTNKLSDLNQRVHSLYSTLIPADAFHMKGDA